MNQQQFQSIQSKDLQIELNLGSACNFNCSYCFEGSEHVDVLPPMSDEVIKRVGDLTELATSLGRPTQLIFWGGEPLIYLDKIEAMVERFKNNTLVRFMFYTNGWYIIGNEDRILRIYKPLGNGRLNIQVSYDFMPIELNHRVCRGYSPEESAKRVLRAMYWLDEQGIEFNHKSTSTYRDLEDHLFEQYVNFIEFQKRLRNNHSPSINITPDGRDRGTIDEAKFGHQLELIIRYAVKHGIFPSGLSWFDQNARLKCSSGYNACCVDCNGDMLYCHGCLEVPGKSNLIFGNIFDDNALYKIDHNNVYERDLARDGEECQGCSTKVCYRCNAYNCDGSVDGWQRPNCAGSCELMRIASRYHLAYEKVRDRVAGKEVTACAGNT